MNSALTCHPRSCDEFRVTLAVERSWFIMSMSYGGSGAKQAELAITLSLLIAILVLVLAIRNAIGTNQPPTTAPPALGPGLSLLPLASLRREIHANSSVPARLVTSLRSMMQVLCAPYIYKLAQSRGNC
jgi:hypothetical protein